MQVAGIDGCKSGWVAVVLDEGLVAGVEIFATFKEAIQSLAGVPWIGVDMPIGLSETGPRACDLEGRRLLGTRRVTLFEVPPRRVLEAPDYQTAKKLSEPGPKPSLQVFRLRPKILEVEAALAARTTSSLIFEVHPELSFLELSQTPLPSKKTWNGFWRRFELLRKAGIEIPAVLREAAGATGPDDILDAAAAAWTARRRAAGDAVCLPSQAESQPGRSPAIWY